MTDVNGNGAHLDTSAVPEPGEPPEEVVSRLTLAEKASLTSGADFWHTEEIARPGGELLVPRVALSDGPHGLRKQPEQGEHLGAGDSVPATCFPPAVGVGSSLDTELLERVGAAIADEARAEGVHVVLGPGINIKRSPLCGRNFEYYSEDPLVSGALGAAFVRGVQSRGVGASLKHFAANNQEHDRLRISAEVDERPLREIYLRGFARVVAEAQPWTVMCSYNRLNGVYTSQHPWLLTQVLREEWGFDGLVVSDWGAVDDRVAGLAAGLDLEMPSSGGRTDAQLVEAVRSGELEESALDRSAGRVVRLVRRAHAAEDPGAGYNAQAHHALAREAAARSIVLLKNEGGLLPLAEDGQRLAVLGEFARTPRYQGGGSSHINPTRVDSALDEFVRRLGSEQVDFAPGFPLEGDESDEGELLANAVTAAASAHTAVVFLGLPAEAESEGYDRAHLRLPEPQLRLLDAVLEVNPRTVAVLSNGGAVEVSGFADAVPALLEGWLLGQAGGSATVDVLYGDVNPSARLTETLPHRLQDTPAYLDFPGELGHVRYGEGVFVGYRWYDARQADVAFPFGHGLSYTTFGYRDLAVAQDADGLLVRCTVANTGRRAGREVVQVYVGRPDSRVARPPRELKAFASVHLEPGEERELELRVRRADLAYWDTRADRWLVEGGRHAVDVGASSRDLRLSTRTELAGDDADLPLGLHSTLGELLAHPVAGPAFRRAAASAVGEEAVSGLLDDPTTQQMAASFPVGRLPSFFGATLDLERLEQLLGEANEGR
ncbi:glycoside hydrolase family 3 C-terminal domain-containing protein [Streptomyces sulphureus]|uniref:glycoside hydrolase family 3 C-terminal domain-containing protein n=1 Tax=Streptomyces sulphureus TaxID=47758 RepID=UPI000377415B|nr:glycoside hydrolase family 3 C-terminal domain-containing protein [Streptomyces sulphureus]